VPLCAFAVLAVGGATPPGLQNAKAFSNPPFCTAGADADGVTGLEGADAGPLPFGFDAVTVNVYDVPFAKLVTIALVGAGDPDTVVGVKAVAPA
jgi:hypothetical protein